MSIPLGLPTHLRELANEQHEGSELEVTLRHAADEIEKLQAILLGRDVLAWDNSNPPQLWSWRGPLDESAEPWNRIRGAKDAVTEIERLRKMRSLLETPPPEPPPVVIDWLVRLRIVNGKPVFEVR